MDYSGGDSCRGRGRRGGFGRGTDFSFKDGPDPCQGGGHRHNMMGMGGPPVFRGRGGGEGPWQGMRGGQQRGFFDNGGFRRPFMGPPRLRGNGRGFIGGPLTGGGPGGFPNCGPRYRQPFYEQVNFGGVPPSEISPQGGPALSVNPNEQLWSETHGIHGGGGKSYHYHTRTKESKWERPERPDVRIIPHRKEMGPKKSLFHCDPCSKSFFDQTSLDSHKAEHMICKLDGCTFTAHPNVVVKHIQMQHSTDLYHKIAGYSTTEEIQVWIKERKMNFPTSANVERKRLEREERLERGERISKPVRSKDALTQIKRKRSFFADRHDALRRKMCGYSHRPVTISGNKSDVVTLKNFYASVKKNAKGVLEGKELTLWTNRASHLKTTEHSEHSDISDGEQKEQGCITDEDEDTSTAVANYKMYGSSTNTAISVEVSDEVATVREKYVKTNVWSTETDSTCKTQVFGISALSTLASYSSDSEMEDGEIKDNLEDFPTTTTVTVTTNPEMKFNSTPSLVSTFNCNHNEESDDSNTQPKELKIERQPEDANPKVPLVTKESLVYHKKALGKIGRKVNKKLNRGKEGESNIVDVNRDGEVRKSKTKKIVPKPKSKPIRRPLLLEHMLAPEIQYERNCLLQLCRFIVENNFFEGPLPELYSNFLQDEKSRPQSQQGQAQNPMVIEVPTLPIVEDSSNLIR